MNLSKPFIERPVMTLLVMAALVFFGIFAYFKLPISDLPNIDLPTIEVSVDYPGASPETMANSVATPLEKEFSTIGGIETISSSSHTGSSSIVLQFALSRDIDGASTDVQAAISRAEPNLPSDLPNAPSYKKINPTASPILFFVMNSDEMDEGQLYEYANTFIGRRLSIIDGVSQVLTYGSPYAVRIQFDPEKLAAKNIGVDEFVKSIQSENVDLSLGALYGQSTNYIIESNGELKTAKGYESIIIKNEMGQLVKLQDVGRALDSVEEDKFFHYYVTKEGSKSAIFFAVQRLPGKNTLAVITAINKVLEELIPQLPQAIHIERIYDQSDSILEGSGDVKTTLIISFFLVILIIYFSLGKALNTLIPALSLPITIIATFAFMYPIGFSLDLLSLLAINLSIGFLVDDAIVVLENSVRHMQLGKTPFEGALIGAKEISTTILSMSLCLIAAFIPMLFMGGVVGKLFQEFAVTLVLAVFISLFVSLSFTPMLASRLIKPYQEKKKGAMERFADACNDGMKRVYAKALHWSLDHKKTMLTLGFASIVCSLFLFTKVPGDFLPPDDVGYIEGFTLAQDGTSPYLMKEYHQRVSNILIEDPNVESITSISSYSNPNEGILYVRLQPFKKRLPMADVIRELTVQLGQVPGINVFLSPLPLINLNVGVSSQALYQYALTSLSQETLYTYSENLKEKLETNPYFAQVSSDLRIGQPQWILSIDREKASNYDLSAEKMERFLSFAYSDNKISQINAPINQYDVILETLPQFYKNPSVLSSLYIRSEQNALVPLQEVVNSTETVGPLTINHVNGLPAVNISFNTAKGVGLGEILTVIEQEKRSTPVGVFGQLIGTAQIFEKSFASLKILVLLSFFVIYVLLGILYESFVHPITVMSSLPPALVGGLFALYIFKQTLSIYSFVGIILLMGIVLKNGIMMIDFAIQASEKEKKNPYDAIVEAALIRFRPIMMTTFAAGMGAVPVALGVGGALAQNRISLGVCIVGGLIVSQVLTLLLTPVLFYYFEVLQEKLFRKKR